MYNCNKSCHWVFYNDWRIVLLLSNSSDVLDNKFIMVVPNRHLLQNNSTTTKYTHVNTMIVSVYLMRGKANGSATKTIHFAKRSSVREEEDVGSLRSVPLTPDPLVWMVFLLDMVLVDKVAC